MSDEWDPWRIRKQPQAETCDMNGNWASELFEYDDSGHFGSEMEFTAAEREFPHSTGDGVIGVNKLEKKPRVLNAGEDEK